MKTIHLADQEFDQTILRLRYLVLSDPEANWALQPLLDVMDDQPRRREWGETVLLTLVKGGRQ